MKEKHDTESHCHLLRWLHRGVAAPSVMVSGIMAKLTWNVKVNRVQSTMCQKKYNMK